VVHTVSSADPLEDLPAEASSALARTLLIPTHGDLGGVLERCDAVRHLLDRWQDAFFAALPDEVDLEEESRWAAEAGLSLDEIDAEWEDPDWEDDADDWDENEESPGQLGLQMGEQISLSELGPLDDDPADLFDLGSPSADLPLDEEVVAELEVALLLLPLRVRLEALVAAAALVEAWADLYADHEKVLGHLVLTHGVATAAAPHEVLLDQHAALHAGLPGHSAVEDSA
jgi:hypothetical protein